MYPFVIFENEGMAEPFTWKQNILSLDLREKWKKDDIQIWRTIDRDLTAAVSRWDRGQMTIKNKTQNEQIKF